jgi:hypothetical protein
VDLPMAIVRFLLRGGTGVPNHGSLPFTLFRYFVM